MTIKKLGEKLKIEFKNKSLIKQAFIHRSYINENPDLKQSHNERLEFLGDAVLELAVTEYLYNNFQKKSEGILTTWRASLVKGETLAKISKELDLGSYLKLSKGEEQGGGREKAMILADCLEAVIGAIYLDQGFKVTKKFIDRFIIKYLDEIIKGKTYIDSKTYLQEMAQEKFGVTPTYEVVSETGPDHNKKFTVVVHLGETKGGQGLGSSKQKAQVAAAKQALKNQEVINGKNN